MFGEKHWRLSSPFRRFSGKQDPRFKSKVGHSRSRVSSVYLSDDTSTSGFIVVPEFDGSVRTQTTHEESNRSTHPPTLPAVTSPDPLLSNRIDSCLCDLEPGCDRGSGNTSIPTTSLDDDLSQRLGSAYEHIHSMSSAIPPKASLSSDPQMLRKQLGVPQHSVFNYPIHSSPDLPNPHIFPLEPTSPKLPNASSPDVVHAKTSKKPGLSMNTDVYPVSHRRGFLDSVQLTQMKSVAAVPTLTENSPSQSPVLEAPRSAHSICTPEPQPSITYSPTLAKSHAEEPISTPSSSPSSRRQASRGVLRKPVPNTPLCTNAHKQQIPLPRIRPPSPLKVDIPLHHIWHERRTNFDFFSGFYVKKVSFHETKSRRTRGSTDALASLAWTGTAPLYTADKECYLANPGCLPDHFSMGIAVEDDSISDDALVDRLEKVRRISDSSERGRDISPWGSLAAPNALAKPCDVLLPSPLITQDATSDSEDAEVWRAARKALLCVREIVRTEKKYQEALKMLLNAQTATPPPPSMDPYILALVRVSETLLRCFLEDPSAWGVSTAFVTSEDELEAAMVSWCAVAGALFTDENDPRSIGLVGRWRYRKSGVTSSSSSAATKAMSIPLSPRLPPILPMINTTGKIKKRTDEEYGARQYPQMEHHDERRSAFISLQKPGQPEGTNSQTLTGRPPSRKPSVRELAIQPIQRVMRYIFKTVPLRRRRRVYLLSALWKPPCVLPIIATEPKETLHSFVLPRRLLSSQGARCYEYSYTR
ncbi:hypothetical protein JVT61DRAFT_5350 [Boletus reticuloceps]|uniref:DH domain-containing protein n=1 Tax=Boletus reticuloceps TaxID=495285 RepID=A0A8I3AD03_9AGAM|nr:hypothetical protein JVT61DRAFT_5350 [Boletus reticuloceps]